MKVGTRKIGVSQATIDELGRDQFCITKTNSIKMKSAKIRTGFFIRELLAVLSIAFHPTAVRIQKAPKRRGRRQQAPECRHELTPVLARVLNYCPLPNVTDITKTSVLARKAMKQQ
jgi:hypothetical protein